MRALAASCMAPFSSACANQTAQICSRACVNAVGEKMKLRLPSFGRFGRPRGLQARAVLFTATIMAVTALLSASIIIFGVQSEGERQQLAIAHDLTEHLASRAGDVMARGNTRVLSMMISGAVRQDNVRMLAVRDAQGRVLAQAGGSDRDSAALAQLTQGAIDSGRTVYQRRPDGAVAVAAPIIREGDVIGVALRVWERDAYKFDAVPSLAPFLLIIACLAMAAIPLTAHAVRRAIAPLDELARHAERMGEQERTEPIKIQTGDEFETLANAFNSMTGRLEASMRQIQEIAFVDPATRLPNHDRFHREVDFFLLQNRQGQAAAAVIVVELARLPRLMQTLDPDAAREFLRVVAERLTAAVRTVDRVVRISGSTERRAIAARLARAEFAVFVPEIASVADAARFAQHLNAALDQPFDWRGHKLTVGACCGVALAPRDGRDADAAIRHARMAMAAAYTSPSRVKVYTQSLDREAVARLTLEREMRGALERNEFRAYFQPKINLGSRKIEACEALARWIRPDRTIVSPGRFIPVAEESGLVGVLSDAIMREACWKAASWARAGHPTKVAVNVSALQFRSDRFADNVLRVVAHAGLAPGNLELEITESMVMADPDRALRIIKPLRDAGVRLAIDDFGCGHSSLAALSKLPFDVIKIDQQFVRALERGDAQSAAIVEMILALARTLGMEVVAEGVERPEEMEFMAARGCHWIQGFLFGAAVSAPEFAELLRRQAGEEIRAEDAA
jgi:EAL domain-containing protein (putative c-di-GMP-specific phosphodiesterase class I)/GGDEF domain-containing protein